MMTTTHVTLLRDVPEHGLRSMERFADEIERGFAGHPRVRMTPTTVHEPRVLARVSRRAAGYAARYLRYPLAARSLRSDIYHIADHGYGHLAAVLPPARTVVSCHDLMLLQAEDRDLGFRGGRLSVARFRWSTSYLRRVAHVVCPSQATKRDLVRLRGVDPARISIVPYGVDARFRPMPDTDVARFRAELPLRAEHLLLHVSTGDAYKNVPATLRVLAAIRAMGHDAALVRVGAPLRKSELVLARALNIAGAVLECGRVTDDDLVAIYNAADMLLFPSFWEGYGWPPLEAMACGTPVVTSDCAPLVEVTADAALRAPADDIAALTSSARHVLTSPETAARLRTAGLARAAEFSWSRTVAGIEQAYDAVLAAATDDLEATCAA